MAKDLTTKNETLPSTNTETNPWLAYGNTVASSRIVGRLLKFTKFGQFVAGEEAEEVPMNTELMVHADEILVGYIKWAENRPVDTVMGRLCDGFEPPKRSELGDTDKELWEVDDNNQSRDPWQFSAYVVMYDPEAEQIYTFATASKGGHKAVGIISKAYGQRARMMPEMFPVVRLNWTEYEHSNPRYGKIWNPVFDIVGWSQRDKIDQALQAAVGEATAQAEADQDAADYYDTKPAPKQVAKPQAKPAQRDTAKQGIVPPMERQPSTPQPHTLSSAARKPRF